MGKASEIWKEVKPKIGEMLAAVNDIETRAEKAQEEAYQKGLSDGKNQDAKDFADMYDSGYSEGLKDAWECARKIWENDIDTLHKIFGWVPMRMDVFLKFTAAEVIEKLKAYEQEQKEQIQVGDEVLVDDDIKGVVLDIDEYIIHVFDENGLVMAGDKELMTKTGRQFPEIAEVLKKMREN